MQDTILKVSSKADLEEIRARYTAAQKRYKFQLFVCSGAGCVSSGCHAVRKALTAAVMEAGLADCTAIHETGCIGSCHLGPALIVQPEGILYVTLQPEDMSRIVNLHLRHGEIVESLCYYDKEREQRVPRVADIEYFKRQMRIVTARCGTAAFDSIDAYIATDGY